MNNNKIHVELMSLSNSTKAKNCLLFFKMGKGEYGHGDKFLGLTNPQIVGAYCYEQKDNSILYDLSQPHDLWEKRISIILTTYFITILAFLVNSVTHAVAADLFAWAVSSSLAIFSSSSLVALAGN